MSKKVTIGVVTVVIGVLIFSGVMFINNRDKNEDPLISKFPKNNVELEFEKGTVSPMIAIVNEKDEVNIKVSFKNGEYPREVYLMNKERGERTDFKKTSDNTAELKIKLEHGIDYGYIIDGRLAGGIKGVENVKKADIKNERKQMLDVLQCGLE